MSDQERLRVTKADSGRFEVHGEIDAASAPLLAEQVTAEGAGSSLVLDMSNVTFIDSSGLRVMLALADRGSSGGAPLCVADPSRAVMRLLEISGLVDHFEIVHDVA
jgi:anti-anti-sigma factor